MESERTPADVLRAVFHKLNAAGGWCQGVYAKDAEGVSVMPEGESACIFCLDGAMESQLCGSNFGGDELQEASYSYLCAGIQEADSTFPGISLSVGANKRNIQTWNDALGRTYADVLHAVSLAINKAAGDELGAK